MGRHGPHRDACISAGPGCLNPGRTAPRAPRGNSGTANRASLAPPLASTQADDVFHAPTVLFLSRVMKFRIQRTQKCKPYWSSSASCCGGASEAGRQVCRAEGGTVHTPSQLQGILCIHPISTTASPPRIKPTRHPVHSPESEASAPGTGYPSWCLPSGPGKARGKLGTTSAGVHTHRQTLSHAENQHSRTLSSRQCAWKCFPRQLIGLLGTGRRGACGVAVHTAVHTILEPTARGARVLGTHGTRRGGGGGVWRQRDGAAILRTSPDVRTTRGLGWAAPAAPDAPRAPPPRRPQRGEDGRP